jgi:hypothetical protein
MSLQMIAPIVLKSSTTSTGNEESMSGLLRKRSAVPISAKIEAASSPEIAHRR